MKQKDVILVADAIEKIAEICTGGMVTDITIGLIGIAYDLKDAEQITDYFAMELEE